MSLGRYRRLLGRRPVQEADAELQFHVDMRVEELMARGMSEPEARRVALARLGDFTGTRNGCIEIDRRLQRRETVRAIWETLVQDVRLAARMLGRQKMWTALAVITLGIGIGANSALFSIINAVLLKPLPYADPDRIMSLTVSFDGRDLGGVEEPAYLAWTERTKSFSAMAAYRTARTIMKGDGDPESVAGRIVTYGYFSIFGTRPLLGRTFTPDEDRPGAPSVIILSEQIWRRIYGGDSSVVNRTVLLDGTPTTVIGIMPTAFSKHGSALFWRPYRMRPPDPAQGIFYTSVMARLAPGVSMETAFADLETALPKPAFARPDGGTLKPVIMTLQERRYGDTRPALLMLFAAVAVLLLIACANVANLLLARAARRQREFAVRSAIGASSWRLVRFTLCESVLLSAMGAAVGLALAAATLGTFIRLSPPAIARADGIAVNGTVMLFAFTLALLTGIGFGLIPALQVRRTDLNSVLSKGSTRTAGGLHQSWIRRVLVVAELGTALMLVTGAGLLLKSFATVTSVDPGLDPRRIVVSTIDLPRRYDEPAALTYFDAFLAGVEAIPGVETAALADAPPLSGRRASRTVEIPGAGTLPNIDISEVQPGYFRAAGMTLVAGRFFDQGDLQRKEPVIILNEMAARVYGRGQNVVGTRMPLNGRTAPPVMVVGVVRDIMQRGVEEAVEPMMYKPLHREDVGGYMHVVARTAGDPRAVLPAIRSLARRLDPALPMHDIRTLEDDLSGVVAPRKFSFLLVGAFAAVGALLGIIGLYGVMSYLVAERTNEIGVRVALGADGYRVTRMVVGEGMVLAGVGVAFGLAGSLGAVRLLRTMLFKVSIYDPSIFASAAALMVLTAFIACALPARRAAQVDPVEALRSG